jgi:hypothetical protein
MAAAFARAVSVVGHPLPVLSGALLLRAFHGGAGRAQLLGIAVALALFAAAVMAYSWWRVRGGHWGHVDASHAGERRQLNRFLLVLLLAGATLAAAAGQAEFAWQLALAAALVLAAALTARWCKLSLHLAFAVYAAALLALVSWLATAALLLLAALLAWSRLHLARHAPRDLWAGALAGLSAGALAWPLPLGGQG